MAETPSEARYTLVTTLTELKDFLGIAREQGFLAVTLKQQA